MTSIIVAMVVVFGAAQVNVQPPPRPRLGVLTDGFPGGHSSPEGAACDLARAFIQHDPQLFRSTCIKPYGPAAYAEFLDGVVESMKQEASRATPSPGGPKSIGKLFAARPLSMEGPSSYGYAVYDFQEVMFVDVGVTLHNGKRALNRTLVIKDKEGSWYVHPAPDISPLLSMGLNEESPSEQDFSAVYEISK